jgi:hypothetical protein
MIPPLFGKQEVGIWRVRHIFLSNYWWQRSDIWSQASYRYPILWEVFLDPSDSKYQISAINSYWEKCDEKYLGRTDGQMDRGKTVYPPPPSGSGGIIMVVGWFIVATCTISAYHLLSCEFEPRSWRGVFDTTLCDKVCQWLATGKWFSPGTPASSTNKTDRHDIAVILLKVALNTINIRSRRPQLIMVFSHWLTV